MTTSTSHSGASPDSGFTDRSEQKALPRVRLTGPGHLIAALPHLLGFPPENSLVLIGHQGERGTRVTVVQRVDLPPPELEAEVAAHLVDNLLRHEISALTVVIVGSLKKTESDGALPHGRLIELVTDQIMSMGLSLVRAFWISKLQQGVRWSCYDDLECAGELPDPSSTVLAAVSAAAGSVTFPSREAVRQLFQTDDEATLARRSALLDEADDFGFDLETRQKRGFSAIRAAFQRIERHTAMETNSTSGATRQDLQFTDLELVRLGCALEQTLVRDTCLALAVPDQDSEEPAARKFSEEAEKLWWILVRALPISERAESAALLGYSAYQRGDGTVAGMAFEVALEADPDHVLAGLLAQALYRGLSPSTLAGIARPDNLVQLYGAG
jgi:hypothetical protein